MDATTAPSQSAAIAIAILRLADRYAKSMSRSSLFSEGVDKDRDALANMIRVMAIKVEAHEKALERARELGYTNLTLAMRECPKRKLDPAIDGVPGDTVVPPITEPMGKHWTQPNPGNMRITAEAAIMSDAAFKQLHEYSSSLPSGVYSGKMWRRFDGEWLLVWFGPSTRGIETECTIHRRKIHIHPKVEVSA